MIFVFEELLEDQFVINMLLQMMQAIFPECDHSCKNMDRMFFGGKELIYFDGEARMTLVRLLYPVLESLDVGNHFRENIRQLAKKANILLLNGHLAMGRCESLLQVSLV